MKKIKAILLSLVLVAMMMPSLTAQAADNSNNYFNADYTYTVTIYTGAQGTFASGATSRTFSVKPGDIVDLSVALKSMNLKNGSKYYAKGVREAGKDNNTVKGSAFTVKCDIDYVIAYGLEGGDVAYTIEYVDADGNALAPSETHYGNEGEKPVVAFKYINGYVPQALNLTKTLSSDTSKNVFRFTYVPGNMGGYNYTVIDDGITIIDRGLIDQGTIPGGGGTVTNNGNVNIVDNQNGGNAETIEDNETPQAGPNEIIDLDDGSVPLAGNDLDFEYVEPEADKVGVGGLPLGVKLLLGGCGVALVGAVTGLVLLNKKKKEEDE